MTVLRTVGVARATKRFVWSPTLQKWRKISYQAGAWFTATEHPVGNLAELVAVLDQVRRDPGAFVVRGALMAAARDKAAADPAYRIRRRKLKKGDIEPSLLEVSRQWIMLDIDHWPLPDWADLADEPGVWIDNAIHELLPPEFHAAECWWQLSSSAGFVPGILKVHLFFWLTEPATNQHIKAVLQQHAPGVDCAPFNAAQPHYIADPIIEGGYDPLPCRTGWRKGLEPAVTLPVMVAQAAKPYLACTGATGRPGDIVDALAVLGHGNGGQGFHSPLRTATLRYARQCNRTGTRDDEAFKTVLRAAIHAAPCRPGGNVETPYCQDYYLDSLITGAFSYWADVEIPVIAPHYTVPTQPAEAARVALAEHIHRFMDDLWAWNTSMQKLPPPHAAIAATVGLGKSTEARAALTYFIATAKAAGRSHRVLWLVPTHKLGNETLAAMQDLGLSAAVMRGRDADEPGTADPENDVPAQKMCLNMPAVQAAIAVCHDIEQAACGSGQPDQPVCPYRDECAYQRQKPAAIQADVLIASHQTLFHHLPNRVGDGFGLVVIDEGWWQAGLHPNREIPLAGFADEPLLHPVLRPNKGGFTGTITAELDTNDLHAISVKAQAAFMATAEDDFVSRASVLAAGLTVEDCAIAERLEWRRMIEPAVWPAMNNAVRKQAVERAAGNRAIPRRATVWKALQGLLAGDETHTGRLQLGTRDDQDGARRVILLHSRDEIRTAISDLPILCLDATMPAQMVRHYLPRLEVMAEVQAAAPHMTVHQITGGWGKTTLIGSDRATPEENRHRGNKVGELVDFVRLTSGGDGLVVTYQAIEPQFAVPGVRTAHFNAIRGLDAYREIRSLFVIGRPLPDIRQLRADALALTGRPIALETGQTESRGVTMADGTVRPVKVRVYEDPDLEAMRTAITEAEVIQAIGRARGVNRQSEQPLDVFIFADMALPLPITRLLHWDDVRPGVVTRMAARSVVLLNSTDSCKAYPDLFPTPEAAKKALQRANMKEGGRGHSPRIGFILGECPRPDLVELWYQPEGKGVKPRQAWVAENQLAPLETWLTERLSVRVHVLQTPSAVPELTSEPTQDPTPATSGLKTEQELLQPEVLYPVMLKVNAGTPMTTSSKPAELYGTG